MSIIHPIDIGDKEKEHLRNVQKHEFGIYLLPLPWSVA
jgi:hypothetical protein